MGKRHDVEETGTPLECGIAGVLSTYPPFTAQHPMTLLPIAKAIVAALPEWSDDLLAVLVEAQGRAWVMDALMKGVSDVGSPARLESDSDWLDTMTGTGNAPLHDPRRRTEGNTR